MHGLKDLRVVDLSSEIAGPYCTKLFADAGADVIKVEPPAGDPLRRWSATGAELGGRDGPLFRFLNASKRSVVGAPGDVEVDALIASADLVVDDAGPAAPFDRAALLARHPGLVILSISPFGLEGPYASRPATEFTLQAECGSIAGRGRPEQEPFQCGGRVTEWIGGAFSSVAALAAVRGARASGHGELVDFSLQEVMAMATTTFMDLMWSLVGRPPVQGAGQNVETPSIEPTSDGFVGFNTNTAQQISDFLLMIERPELRESGEWNLAGARMARMEEWEGIVHAWTRQHTTAEIIELASVLRIPVAPICNGRTILEHEQLVERGVYSEDPSGGFQRPRPPYQVDGASPAAPRPAPALGEHGGVVEPREPSRPANPGRKRLPLEGVKIVDATTWWAGPSATHLLASLGADVVHVESTKKPDGARTVGFLFAAGREEGWECSNFFLSANANKRGITLDLSDERGKEALRRLLAEADLLVENFSPRVMDGFGVTREWVQEVNPRCSYVRMPAFGLDGPWRENVGFAQTMEQMAGLAWLTGHADDQPRIQRGPCDPLAGVHAAFASLVALAERDASGRGSFVECTMVEGALNAAAEQVAEFTAHGTVMQREGNRSPKAAPQGLYPCRGHQTMEDPRWLALSVETDAQWHALLDWIGNPSWAEGLRSAGLTERRAAHDKIDEHLRVLFADRDRDVCVEELVAAGVPAATLVDGRLLSEHPQLVHRGSFESLDHPIVGALPTMTVPFRFGSVAHWNRRVAPTMGQHNREVLSSVGFSDEEIDAMAADDVIGTRPSRLG